MLLVDVVAMYDYAKLPAAACAVVYVEEVVKMAEASLRWRRLAFACHAVRCWLPWCALVNWRNSIRWMWAGSRPQTLVTQCDPALSLPVCAGEHEERFSA